MKPWDPEGTAVYLVLLEELVDRHLRINPKISMELDTCVQLICVHDTGGIRE